MRVSVHAVGRMKAGPEKDLADRYFDRFAKAGPGVSLEFAGIFEIVESRGQSPGERKADEAARIMQKLQPACELVLLDERGLNLASDDIATHIARIRDAGRRDLAIAIGGPDGFDTEFRAKAGLVLSFGKATWPHQMARVMLGEQLYRAATILSGHPYHRA